MPVKLNERYILPVDTRNPPTVGESLFRTPSGIAKPIARQVGER